MWGVEGVCVSVCTCVCGLKFLRRNPGTRFNRDFFFWGEEVDSHRK